MLTEHQWARTAQNMFGPILDMVRFARANNRDDFVIVLVHPGSGRAREFAKTHWQVTDQMIDGHVAAVDRPTGVPILMNGFDRDYANELLPDLNLPRLEKGEGIWCVCLEGDSVLHYNNPDFKGN